MVIGKFNQRSHFLVCVFTGIFLMVSSAGCGYLRLSTPSVLNIPRPGSESEVSEIGLGRQIHDAIVASQYLYTKPEVVNYVAEIGRKLADISMRPHLPYSFTILADERLYSTAAPGGYVYITTGLLSFFKNESELAGVLAHEIGEIQHQSPVFSSFKRHSEDLAALSALVGSFFGPIGAMSAAGVILLTSVPYGEVDKTELLMDADRMAISMMTKCGYNPESLRDVLIRIGSANQDPQGKNFAFEWHQKRPVTEERLRNLDAALKNAGIDFSSFNTDSVRFTQVMRSIYEMHPAA